MHIYISSPQRTSLPQTCNVYHTTAPATLWMRLPASMQTCTEAVPCTHNNMRCAAPSTPAALPFGSQWFGSAHCCQRGMRVRSQRSVQRTARHTDLSKQLNDTKEVACPHESAQKPVCHARQHLIATCWQHYAYQKRRAGSRAAKSERRGAACARTTFRIAGLNLLCKAVKNPRRRCAEMAPPR